MPTMYGQTYVDVPATGVAVRRIQSDGRFIARRMVPRLNVKKPTGLYKVIYSADLNRDEMEPRGPTAPAKVAGWRTGEAIYKTDARSLEYDANDAEVAASDVETNPEVSIPRVLGYKALLHMERRMSGKFFVDGAWERQVTGAAADANLDTNAASRTHFDDANADPIEALTDEIRRLELRTGADRTQMGVSMGNRIWHTIRNHPKVKAQIVSVGPGAGLIALARQAETEDIRRLLGVAWVGVSTAIYNAAVMHKDPADPANLDNQPIVPQDDILIFVSPNAGNEDADAGMTLAEDQPSAFCRPVWTGVAVDGVQVRKFRKEDAGPSGSWASVIDVFNGFEVVSKECAVRLKGMHS